MSLISWICLSSRRPAGTVSFESPPGPPREDQPTTALCFMSWSHAVSKSPTPVVSRSPDRDTMPAPSQHKWLPVIDTDRCIGCERCIAACEHGCLEMIWSFSTLTGPQNCSGEGHCVEACPEQIIRMTLVAVEVIPQENSSLTRA